MPQKTRKNLFASEDKYLIAEQPGMAVVVSGILIALFIGLVSRAFLSPARLRSEVEKAAGRINKNVQVQFDDAVVSLSDGILPRFAVVISNVRMDSTESCWMAPRLEIDQIRLPVSFWGLLTGQGIVREVQADNVRLILRSAYQDCSKKLAEEVRPEATSQLVKLQDLNAKIAENSQGKNNFVRGVYLSHVQIEYEKDSRYRAEFHDVGFEIKNIEPRWMILNAKTHLFRDEQVGDYLSHANIHVEYKDSPESSIQAHFFGNWREGHYSLIGNYSFADKNVVLETELKHIPLSQVVAILQKYEMADSRINAKKLWLSFHSHYSGEAQKITKLPMEVSDVQIDGDQIEMSVDKINFRSLDPLKYDPIRLDVQKMNIDKLISFFNRNVPTRVLAHLGTFTGQAEIRSDQDIHLLGNYSGLEFIFANKGQRELQIINRMTCEALYKNDQWKINLSHIQPNQGTFDGSLQLEADKTLNDLDLHLKASDVVLAPSVQRLMTQGGDLGAINSQIDLRLRGGKLKGLKGFIKSPHMKIEGVEVLTPKAQVEFVRDEVLINLQIGQIKLPQDSAAMQVMGRLFSNEVVPVMTPTISSHDITNISGQVQTTDFKNLSWQKFSGQLADGGKIQTEGGWDDQGQLKGQVSMRTKKSQQKWLIQGTRAVPEFIVPKVTMPNVNMPILGH